MSDASVVLFDPTRAVIQGLDLPSPPPTRVTISGHTYRLQAPRAVLPPLVNAMKVILNWAGPTATVARNIFFVNRVSGSGSTSDPTFLNAVANQIMTSWATSNLNSKVGPEWTLQSATVKDLGGTTAQSTSTAASIPGTNSGTSMAPGVSIALSWQIAETYRGGKPRTYLPGVPSNATTAPGGSTIGGTFATQLDAAATLFLNDFNSHSVLSTSLQLGTVSYHTSHAVRPTPVFRAWFGVRIHERLDSQRRRNGKESAFPVTP